MFGTSIWEDFKEFWLHHLNDMSWVRFAEFLFAVIAMVLLFAQIRMDTM